MTEKLVTEKLVTEKLVTERPDLFDLTTNSLLELSKRNLDFADMLESWMPMTESSMVKALIAALRNQADTNASILVVLSLLFDKLMDKPSDSSKVST